MPIGGNLNLDRSIFYFFRGPWFGLFPPVGEGGGVKYMEDVRRDIWEFYWLMSNFFDFPRNYQFNIVWQYKIVSKGLGISYSPISNRVKKHQIWLLYKRIFLIS